MVDKNQFDDEDQKKPGEQPQVTEYNKDYLLGIVDKYISGEEICKEYTVIPGLSIVLRDPSRMIIGLAQEEYIKELTMDTPVTIAQNKQTEFVFAAYLVQYGDKVFIESKEPVTGKKIKDIVEYLREHTNETVWDIMVGILIEFQAMLKQAFSAENLKNS